MTNEKFPEFLWLSKKIAAYKDEIQDEIRIKNALHRIEVGLVDLNCDFGDEECQSIRISITGMSYSNQLLTEDIVKIAQKKNIDVISFLKGIFNEIYTNWRIYSMDRSQEFKSPKELELVDGALAIAKFFTLTSCDSEDKEHAIYLMDLKHEQKKSLTELGKLVLLKQISNGSEIHSNIKTALSLSESMSIEPDNNGQICDIALAKRIVSLLSTVSEALKGKELQQ